MEPQRTRPTRRPDQYRAREEARQVIERAERAWRHQVADEERGAPRAGPGAFLFRVALLAITVAAIILLLFERLARLG